MEELEDTEELLTEETDEPVLDVDELLETELLVEEATDELLTDEETDDELLLDGEETLLDEELALLPVQKNTDPKKLSHKSPKRLQKLPSNMSNGSDGIPGTSGLGMPSTSISGRPGMSRSGEYVPETPGTSTFTAAAADAAGDS